MTVIIRYRVAFDKPESGSRKLSLEPVGRDGYVNDDGKWFLAKSNGKEWIRKIEVEG